MNEGTIIADMDTDKLLASDVLIKHGIREPLYIAALKYAGCDLNGQIGLQHMNSLQLSEQDKAKVRNWFENVQPGKTEICQDSILKVEKLGFSYVKNHPVLENINFDIHRGEMVSIVGKNGAGKSTLSGIICGFYKPSDGKVYLNGKDIKPLSIKERGEKIGLVMQSPNQMISKPMISEEVGLGLQVRGTAEDKIKEKVDQVLKICGLYPFRNWPVSALSFGQKKRVSIASILVMDPDILILDEPTAGQDYKHYTEIMEFLQELNQVHGITILMITHDMHLMLEYTKRAIVIADGRMIADNTPAAILTNETIADQAYLKKTSLYDLARACNIENTEEFTNRFITYEKGLKQ